MAEAELECPLRFAKEIYEAGVEQLVDVISRQDDEVGSLLLIGHNPGLESLVEWFSGARARMPTAAMACIHFDSDHWSFLRPATGRLEWTIVPKAMDSSMSNPDSS